MSLRTENYGTIHMFSHSAGSVRKLEQVQAVEISMTIDMGLILLFSFKDFIGNGL